MRLDHRPSPLLKPNLTVGLLVPPFPSHPPGCVLISQGPICTLSTGINTMGWLRIPSNTMHRLYVPWWSIPTPNGIPWVKNSFDQWSCKLLSGPQITLLMLRVEFHQIKYVQGPIPFTFLFYVTTPGAHLHMFILQIWRMSITFPNGNPVLSVFNIWEHLFCSPPPLYRFTISLLVTSSPSFIFMWWLIIGIICHWCWGAYLWEIYDDIS